MTQKSQVVETGAKATDYKVGDRVCVDTHLPCEECFQCKNGVKVFININPIVEDLKHIRLNKSLSKGYLRQYGPVRPWCQDRPRRLLAICYCPYQRRLQAQVSEIYSADSAHHLQKSTKQSDMPYKYSNSIRY